MKTKNLILLCALLAHFNLPAQPIPSRYASGQDQLYYHYFKERRALKLDTERVAILQTRTATAAGLGQAVSRFGLAPQETRAQPISGWSLAGTPAASHTEPATRDLVSRMSGDSSFEFVAPVFVGEDGGPNIVTPDLLVGFEPSVTEQRAEAILVELNAGDIIQRRFGNMPGAYHLRTRLKSGLDVLDVANKLAERPEVKFAEPDMIFTGHGDLIPNDPGFTNLWGMQKTAGTIGLDMKGPQAWDITTGSSNIIVVIIDVGIQPDHPDINQIPGTNFTSDASFDGGPVNGCDNHGTTVAGCVSAIINNNLGTVGIAPGCRCASARAFIANNSCDNSWFTQSSWTVNALAWAQSIGARVSNNSNKYGLQVQSSAIAAVYSSTRAAGMVHFASAGNDATNAITYPASLPGVNAVAALQDGGGLASFSNHGTGLAFSAPGVGIYTTDRTGTNGYASGDYVFQNGTSLASPYAAGVAALVLSINPSLSATNVEHIMQQSCVDLGPPGYDTTYGWGLVNAYNAVVLALAQPPATITVTSTADSGAGTLRAALASAANGDTIDASGVTGTILLTSGELLVTNSVTILGPGPANLAVDGNAASRAFNISGTVVTIAGLTITNGNASGGDFPANSGGGIYTGPGTLTVSNCVLSGNSAQIGGGILANHSMLTVSTSTLSGNSAGGQGGGGIFINAVFGSATLVVSNCALVGNLASHDSGGAIYNNGQASGNGTAQIVNSTLSGNSAGYGAGICNDGHNSGSATLTVSASTLSSNSASGDGGGIYNNGYSGGTGTVQIVNCALSGNSASNSFGGGIFNQGNNGNAKLTVSASILSSNWASDTGGGIYNNGASGLAALTVSASTLSSNSASGSGGGICNNGYAGSGTALVSTSTFTNNSAIDDGGALYNRGINGSATLTVSNSTLRANSAHYGGGIFNDGTSSGKATLTLRTSTLSDNSASSDGGGIYNDGYTGRATLTMTASTLSGNSASGNGAGIYNNGKSSGTGTVQLATSTLSGNLAGGDGGGIYNDGTSSGKAALTVKASTLSGNSAGGGNGSGIRNNGGGGSANVEIGSTILKAGASGGNVANLSGTVSSDGYNLTSDDGGGFLTGTADQINTDPMLGPLQDNGGPTFTQAPLCGSPAIDRGKNLSASATDQRGSPRRFDDSTVTNATGGDGTDIGAFEVQKPCPVAPSLGNIGIVSSQFGFDIAGGSNQVVVVEASSNLLNWTVLATNTLGASPLHFNDPYWTNFQQLFYRAKLVP